MRRRLVLAAIGMLALALVALAGPLAVSTRSTLVAQHLDTLQAEAEQVAAFLDDARSCGEVQLRLQFLVESSGADTAVALLAERGAVVVARDGRSAVVLGPEVAAAFAGTSATSLRNGRLAAAVPLESRACSTALVLQADRSPQALEAAIRGQWLRLGGLAASILALGAAGAAWLAGRFAAPLEQLAARAAALGEGELAADAPRSGLAEADRIAEALDLTSARLGRALSRSATFAADASHQLRTPLTALRLQLDALEAALSGPVDEDRESGGASVALASAQAEADRLQATIDELEQLTRADADVAAVDVGDVVAERLPAWRAMAAEQGREVEFDRGPVPLVLLRAGAIGQAAQVLFDNALVHGRGRVLVRVRADVGAPSETPPSGPSAASHPGPSPDRSGRPAQVRAVRVEVLDEGPGLPPDALEVTERLDRSGGRGLPLARSLVEAEGGRLSVVGSPEGGTVAGMVIPLGGRDVAG